MTKVPQLSRKRGSLRLPQYDYSEPNAYFITVCTFQKQELFGKVANERMHLNEAGGIVWNVWETLGKRYPQLELDTFVVMPNHIHGILKITSDEVGAMANLRLARIAPTNIGKSRCG